MNTKKTTVSVDMENNAVRWWHAVRSKEPHLAEMLEDHGTYSVTDSELARLKRLPGWTDKGAPAHAPHPLVVVTHGGARPGAGRKPIGDQPMTQVTVQLTKQQIDKLNDAVGVIVTVDDENNGDQWWQALRDECPDFALRLEEAGTLTVSTKDLAEISQLPGWNDGTEYAPHPLIVGKQTSWSSIIRDCIDAS